VPLEIRQNVSLQPDNLFWASHACVDVACVHNFAYYRLERMYKKYFTEFYISSDELKRKILDQLKQLASVNPEEFDSRWVDSLSTDCDANQFIQQIVKHHSLAASENDFIGIEVEIVLRLIAIRFATMLDCELLEAILLNLIFRTFSTQFLCFRYMFATEIIKKELGEELASNYDLVTEDLLNHDASVERNRIVCVIVAEREIGRVIGNEKTRDLFIDFVEQFESSVENHIKKALPQIVLESLVRAFMEGIVANASYTERFLGSNDTLNHAEAGQLFDELYRFGKKQANVRLGIPGRGGLRKTSKFTWTNERKIAFYYCVSSLPKINGEPLWNYAYDELNEKSFSWQIINFLRNETPLKNAPEKIWQSALKTWEKYKDSLTVPKASETPAAFAMMHALKILKYPDTKFSTLKKYFGQGKKLSQMTPTD
jgi:hypothetical protein